MTKEHIKKGLQIMRIVSVKYSSPNSVSGRFPGFDRAILAKSFPAYAYFAASAPSLAMDGSLGEINTLAIDTENIKMFLRLYDTGTTVLIWFLKTVSFVICFLPSKITILIMLTDTNFTWPPT